MLGTNKSDMPVGRRDVDSNQSLTDFLKEGMGKAPDGKPAPGKLDPSVPASLSIINNKTEPKDLLEGFAERLASSKHFKEQVEYRQQTQARLNQDVEKLFKREFQDKSTDSVVLSAKAATYKKDEIKRQSDALSRSDVDQPMEEDTVLDRVEKRLAATARASSGASSAESAPPRPMGSVRSASQESLIQETMKQYISAVSEDLIQQTPGKKKEVSDIRERLQSMGISSKRISEVQNQVTSFVSHDLKEKIKKGFTQFALSYSKKLTPELLASSKQYKVLEQMGLSDGLLQDPSDIKELKDQAKREMGSFLADALDQTLIKEKTRGAPFKELVAAFNQFNELASVVKFDAGSYMKELGRKIENLGFNHFVPPEASRGHMDTDSGGGRRDRQAPPEMDVNLNGLDDQLRRLVIQRVMRTDIIGAMEVRYKISRIRSQLKKSGGLTNVELSDIEQEGEALARIKLIDMLREALEERATLSALEGPAYDLVRAKLKKALKGLRKLGAPIPKEEFNGMKDQINKGMFTVIKEEFLKIDAVFERSPSNKAISQKRKQLLAILQRLRKESSIAEDVTNDQRHRVAVPTDGAIVEAA